MWTSLAAFPCGGRQRERGRCRWQKRKVEIQRKRDREGERVVEKRFSGKKMRKMKR